MKVFANMYWFIYRHWVCVSLEGNVVISEEAHILYVRFHSQEISAREYVNEDISFLI